MTMDREQAKAELKTKEPEFLTPARTRVNGHTSYICPNCGNGSGSSGDGIALDPNQSNGKRWKCFRCNLSEDIIGLWKLHTKITDNATAFKGLYEYFGMSVEGNTGFTTDYSCLNNRTQYQNQPKTEQYTHNNIHTDTYTQQPQPEAPLYIEDLKDTPKIDFTDIVKQAHMELLGNSKALAYLQGRGLSIDTINKYMLGFDAQGYNHLLKDYPDQQSKSRKSCLYNFVLPYPDTEEGKYTYFLTEISDRSQIDEYNGKYRKLKKGEAGIVAQIFNERYIQNPPPAIFICEGIYDALSVEEVGGKAIAFVGTAHRRFLSLCKKYKPDTVFIISLDNDGAGQEAINRVKEGLELLGLPYVVRTAEIGKDFNEALQKDKGAFTEYIQQIIEEAQSENKAKEDAEREEYLKTSTAYKLQNFINGIADSVNTPCIPTGFNKLDSLLEGGLYEGLYFVGALNSLGKTTFCTQMVDQIAEQGYDVLIFSLEMASSEIMAKSISRLTLLDVLQNGGKTSDAKTDRGITVGSRYKNYSKTEKELIQRAMQTYSTYADRIYIHEGVGDIGADQVREVIKKHIRITGKKPVVLIDYLQILAPADVRATDKQNTDKAVLELKRISRDYKIPVIAVSSLNRSNYKGQISCEAFKESGAIEYTCDVLIGLEFERAGEKDYNERVEKCKNPRSINLAILKNRHGKTGGGINYEYYTLFNYFKEA